MRKHVIGFLVFSLITISFAFAFSLFRSFYKKRIETVEVETILPGRVKLELRKRLQVDLRNLTYDEMTNEFTGVVEMAWDGTLPVPKDLQLELGLTTASSPGTARVLDVEHIEKPFAKARKFSKIIRWKEAYFQQMFQAENYYGFAEAFEPSEDAGVTKLVFIEQNYLLDAVPVVIKHKEK